MTRAVLFELVDPPAGQRQIVDDVLAAIDFPWWRLAPKVRRDPDGAVLIIWDDDLPQQVRGTYSSWLTEIRLGTRFGLDHVPFTLAHEVGHAVDSLTLTRDDRQALTQLLHRVRPQLGHFDHDHPDAGHRYEAWSTADNAYPSRLNEAFADLFVAAFAPEVWAGHHVRFVHWCDDLRAVRDIVLRSPIVKLPPDVDPDRWSAASIEKAIATGVMKGRDDGRFDPDSQVDREELAVVLDRLGLLDVEP